MWDANLWGKKLVVKASKRGRASRFRMLASPGRAELRDCPFSANAAGRLMLRVVYYSAYSAWAHFWIWIGRARADHLEQTVAPCCWLPVGGELEASPTVLGSALG